eukprot:gene27584-33317_t
MEADMQNTVSKNFLSELEFSPLPPMTPGVELWALFAANGDPIVLSDERDNILVGAQEHELQTVMLQSQQQCAWFDKLTMREVED